jgi:hypothetical protein
MRQIWVRARHEFTFAGQSHATGDVFAVAPLEAVQLQARRAVVLARPPAAPVAAVQASVPTPRRQRRPPRVMTTAGSPLVVAPEAPVVDVVASEPPALEAPLEIDLSLGAYVRKDLRADD